jgi:Haemolysin-III related
VVACICGRAVPGAVALAVFARGLVATSAAAVFGAGPLFVFSTSATYHRLVRSSVARRRWRRVDHAMIYVLIEATYVPVCLLVLPRRWGVPLLVVVSVGAGGGVAVRLVLFERAGRWPALLYMAGLGRGGGDAAAGQPTRGGAVRVPRRGLASRTPRERSSSVASGRIRRRARSAITRSGTAAACSPRCVTSPWSPLVLAR